MKKHKVLCLCCNKEFLIHKSILKQGRGKYCSRGCWNIAGHKVIYKDRRIPALNALFYIYGKNAEYRKLCFDINVKEFEEITSGNCFYCGIEPLQFKKYKSSMYQYNGIDRIDNNSGYSFKNCVPCCGRCNWMKSDMTSSAFLNHINKISENKRKIVSI